VRKLHRPDPTTLGKYSKTAKFLLDEEKVSEEIKDNQFKDNL
jgi:hypothetical protein